MNIEEASKSLVSSLVISVGEYMQRSHILKVLSSY